MAFDTQKINWPGTRAILMVHGIGDASTGNSGAFPGETLRAALGAQAATTAIYTLNYDFINDWMNLKTNLQAGIKALKGALRTQFGDSGTDAVIAEYAGDVLWPVLSADIRFAVRDAYLAQLQQIQLDRERAAFAKGDNPLKYGITIVAHSLGCFHTYEVLTASASEATHRLRPASDRVTYSSVVMMASPLKLIRTIAEKIQGFIPDVANLATLAAPLAIPEQVRRSGPQRCTDHFISVTGSYDPVGGHLMGIKLPWAYMSLSGQKSIIVKQDGLNLTSAQSTATALAAAFAPGGPAINDPHSWTAYVASQSVLLQGGVVV